jgi:hypothetical protein
LYHDSSTILAHVKPVVCEDTSERREKEFFIKYIVSMI